MNSSSQQWFAETKACLGLAIPLAAAQLSEAAIGFIDTVMMGWLGSQNLAAGGLADITFQSLIIIGTGLLSAVGALGAIAYGSGDRQQLQRIASGGIWLTIGLSLPIMILVWNFATIFRFLGQEEVNILLAESYLQAIVWGLPAAFAFAFLKNLVSALNRPCIIMITMIAGISLNAIGNYLLAFGKWGFPALGLAGLGWASTFAFWVKAIAVLSFIILNADFRKFQLFKYGLHWHSSIFRRLVTIGFPIMAIFFVETSLFAMTTYLMGLLGSIPLAAHQIALRTGMITFTVCMGISYATTMRVGQMLGKKDFQGIKRAGYVGISISATFMSFMAFILWIFPEQIVSIYLNVNNAANRETLQLAVTLLGIAAIFQIVDGIQITAAGALRGIKDTQITLLLGIISYWAIGLGSGYFFGIVLQWGSVGFWWGLVLGLFANALSLTWRFHSRTIASLRSLSSFNS
ncbi:MULTISPECIES: MATE family efflux transporter [Spirulina sp. CCY15215]|uniref:MATE family efflux transporter n=1 Tax=Spirulina sp. CCY15215 TaxID=2767591 RepID=UPI00194FB4C2|nr:MATE family efflux transporter [Spirulina major]